MATNGSTEKVDFLGTGSSTAGKKVGEFYLGWSLVSQDKVNNTSTISITYYLSMIGYSHSRDYVGWQVFCNGQKVYDSGMTSISISVSGMKFLCSTTVKIPHNPDGTMSFPLSATYTEYRYDNQAVYAQYTNSGTFELPPLPVAAQITDAENFDDEGNPTIYYDNTSGELVDALDACISFTGAIDDVPYRALSKTDSAYTFELTEEERNILRQGCANATSTSVKFFVRTTIGEKTHYSTLTKTLTIVNSEPTLEPVARDTNARTVELTGDDSKFIKYYSNAYFEVGAQPKKAATITNQYASCGGRTIEAGSGTFEAVNSNTIYYGVLDSRGLTARDFTLHEIIPYIKLTSSLSLGLLTANGTVDFTIKGKYYNGSFGAQNNSMEVEYSVIDKDGNPVFNNGDEGSGWVKLGVVVPSVNDGNYTYTHTITGLDYTQTYTISVSVIDALTPLQTTSSVVAALPVFDWNGDDFHHHTDVVFSNDKRIMGMTTNDEQIVALEPCDSEGDTTLGRGNYDSGEGDTRIYGNNIYFTPKEKIIINGKEYGAQRVLWSGASHMNGAQTAALAQSISEQPNGAVLVFSLYRNGAAEDVSISSFFVSKYEVAALSNAPHFFFMGINAGFSTIGAKYLYIDDTVISGHEGNTSSGSNNGITFNNSSFVLRYVIGV